MPKYRIAYGVPTADGVIRSEQMTFLRDLFTARYRRPTCDYLVDEDPHALVVQGFPTDVPRNVLVREAFVRGCDFLFMLDTDTVPAPGWFDFAFEFLRTHPPCVIGAPYLSADEVVQVLEWSGTDRGTNEARLAVLQIDTNDAIHRRGTQSVANIGTGCIAYNVDVFRRIKQPYFAYQYNRDHTEAISTEDVLAHRQLYFAGVPIYVSWDHWCDHMKVKCVRKPIQITRELIDDIYLSQAKVIINNEIREARTVSERGDPQQNGLAPESGTRHQQPASPDVQP